MLKFELDQNDTAILIIDFQEKLMKAMPDRERVYKNTNLLLATAKQFNIPVIVTEQYPTGLGHTVDDVKEYLQDYDCIEKNSFCACSPEFNTTLNKLKCKSIVVLGSETHICVYQTVRDLMHQGYHVHVVCDGVCSRTQQNYQNGLDLMERMGAIITNAETVVFDLLKVSGTPQFKAVSPLLK